MTNPRKPASQSLVGIKIFVIAASLAGSLFGWAVLAAGQVRDAMASNVSGSAAVQPSTNNTTTQQKTVPSVQQPQQSQQPKVAPTVAPSAGQFRPAARSRSSR
jgi:hypothetical protein